MKMFDAGKTRMIGLPHGKKNYDDMLRRFHTVPACHRQTDGRTERIAISISRVSVLTRDKNKRAKPTCFVCEKPGHLARNYCFQRQPAGAMEQKPPTVNAGNQSVCKYPMRRPNISVGNQWQGQATGSSVEERL